MNDLSDDPRTPADFARQRRMIVEYRVSLLSVTSHPFDIYDTDDSSDSVLLVSQTS